MLVIVGWKLVDDLDWTLFGAVVTTIGVVSTVTFLVVAPLYIYNSIAAGTRAELLNASFGTKYTAEQVLYGGDIINQVIQGQKTRIELTTKQE